MSKTTIAALGIFSASLAIMSIIAEMAIYFVKVPGEHSNFGIDIYILFHFWYIHFTLAVGTIGYFVLSTITEDKKRNERMIAFLEKMENSRKRPSGLPID